MENLDIYNKVRGVPPEAQKIITGGKLNGMTDINPMWRIKTLTAEFGICGIGWRSEIVRQWTEAGSDGRTAAFCNINLYIKLGSEWSFPIPGTGGSMLTDIEKEKPRTSDEAFKMAYTDALSVACKALGIGADIYFSKDSTKYPTTYPTTYQCAVCRRPVPEAIAEKSYATNGAVYCSGTCRDKVKSHEGV